MLEETIKAIVKEATLEALNEIGFGFTKPDEPELEVMTTKQLAAYLQCSVPWLIKNLKSLNIPYKLLHKEYRFVRTEIIRWLMDYNAQKVQKINKNNNYKTNEELKII